MGKTLFRPFDKSGSLSASTLLCPDSGVVGAQARSVGNRMLWLWQFSQNQCILQWDCMPGFLESFCFSLHSPKKIKIGLMLVDTCQDYCKN